MKVLDLRMVLAAKAEGFSMTERPPTPVIRRARKRLALLILRGTTVSSVVLASAFFLLTADEPGRQPKTPEKAPVAIELVDDYVDGQHEDDAKEELPSREEIDSHVACMRAEGFDLPDPVRTEHGWQIEVDDPEALGFETPAWREAAFVTCAPTPPPGRGDLVFGVPLEREEIKEFEDCMREAGFTLPAAMPMDEPGWKFDLSRTDFDLGSESWNRAVFVTCWPGHPHSGP